VRGNQDTLNSAAGDAAAGLSGTTRGGLGSGAIASIGRGGTAPITQKFGHTDFSDTSAYGQSAYAFTSGYTRVRSLIGHPGVDVGVGYGTNLYSPVGSTGVYAGGTGYYNDGDQGSYGPGTGEQLIQVSNGDQLILGQMSQVNLQVGQTVSAGQMVGLSSGENGADIHIDYRRYAPRSTQLGYQIIDSRPALGGAFGRVNGGQAATPTSRGTGSLAQQVTSFAQNWHP
jgi:murein DD-endopeptidase MepM/ murein hydrolase activator NlpD